LLSADFLYLVAAHSLAALGWSSMLLLPLYLDAVGATRADIGAIMGSSALAGLALRPLIGFGLDRWGRRRIIAVGTLLQAAGMACVLLIRSPDWTPYLVRGLFGLGNATVFTGYFTLATDLVPVSRRTEGIALFGISGLVPLLINPLSQALGVEALAIRVFIPLTALLLLSSLWPLARLSEPARSSVGPPPPPAAILRALARRPLWPAWVATLGFAMLVVTFQAFASVTAEARGIGRPSEIWLTYALGAIAVRLFGARMPDRVGPHNLVAPAMAALVGGALLLASADSRTTFLLAGACGGIGHGIGFPVLTSQVASRSPASMRGSAIAGFTGLWDVAFVSAPGLLGIVGDRTNDATMLSLAALVGVAGLVTWMVLEGRFGRAELDDDQPT
jgi:MFS family permease